MRIFMGRITHAGGQAGRPVPLDGALAAAKLQREGGVVAPVLIDLRVQLRRLGEIVGEAAESLDLVAHHVLAEGLAGRALREVMIQHARNGLGRQARWHALHGQSEAHDAFVVEAAAQEHLVIGNLAAWACFSSKRWWTKRSGSQAPTERVAMSGLIWGGHPQEKKKKMETTDCAQRKNK